MSCRGAGGGPSCALGCRHCGWERTKSAPGADEPGRRGTGRWVVAAVGGGIPSCALGVAIVAGNAHLVRSWFPWIGIQLVEQWGADHR